MLYWFRFQLWWAGWDVWFIKRRIRALQEELEDVRIWESSIQNYILEEETTL